MNVGKAKTSLSFDFTNEQLEYMDVVTEYMCTSDKLVITQAPESHCNIINIIKMRRIEHVPFYHRCNLVNEIMSFYR